ncbi:MAG: glycosyltransferase [Anaerolineales bacterium]|nr:glycosyltransferase [Anaerolineales bacterium]
MKIALITNSRIPSLTANSIQAMKVAQALLQLNHEIKLFAPQETETPDAESLSMHYGVRRVPEIKFLPSVKLLKRFDFLFHAQQAVKEFKPDLIYTWLPQSAALGAWLGYPVILEMHADVAGRMGAWWLRQFWEAKSPKWMTVTTLALRNVLERSTRLQLERETLLVAPNGVELERYQNLASPAEARNQLNLKQGLTVGFTGHIYPGRGAELLFALAQQMPAVNFLWVGGAPELVESWRDKLQKARVNNVTLTGFVKHELIHLYQAASDVLLMPYSNSISASSGQDIAEVINPMKMFEYMASGRAILCADLPVIREVLNPENCAFVGAAGNEQSVANWRNAIENLLADEPLRMRLGTQARKDVTQFSWVRREEKILNVVKVGL